jgi:hypothetical protein
MNAGVKWANFVQRILKSGVKFAAGSDMNWFDPGKPRGQASATMFAHLHDAGIRPLDIIRAVTTNAAELMDSRSSSHRNPDRLHLCSCRALADPLPQNSLHLFLSIIPKPFRAHFGSLRVLLLHRLPSPNGDLVPPQPLANHRVRSLLALALVGVRQYREQMLDIDKHLIFEEPSPPIF